MGDDETSEEENNIEERLASKIKRLIKQKAFIIMFSDHSIRRRRNSRDAKVSLRENKINRI